MIAADIIEEALARANAEQRDLVLGVATGSTPLSVYEELAARNLDLSRAWAFALDEYVGLPVDHPESYHEVLRREVIEPLALDPERVIIPGGNGTHDVGDTASLLVECARFEQHIDEVGGIDVQLLGIGTNGHLAFNEPGSALDSITRLTELAHQTRIDNARYFASLDDVPTHAVTQGLGTILRARTIVLLAFGQRKAQALAEALEGDVTEAMPASVIQRHPHAVVLADAEAAALLGATHARGR